MDYKVVCIPSAFKHGIDEAAIRHVFHAHITDVLMEGFDNKYIVIGFDLAGNLLEVMYNRIDRETVKVFHAMKCRRQFREELGIEENTMEHGQFGRDMSDEEYDALDEALTRATPKLTAIPGVFAAQRNLLAGLDAVAANYIQTKAEAARTTPARIIGEMVRREIAAASV